MTTKMTDEQIRALVGQALPHAVSHFSNNMLDDCLYQCVSQYVIRTILEDKHRDGAALLNRPDVIGEAVAYQLSDMLIPPSIFADERKREEWFMAAGKKTRDSIKSGLWHRVAAETPETTDA